MLEIVMFDLKDLASSLKLLIYDAENLLELVFSRLSRAFKAHSLRLNSGSSLLLDPIVGDGSMVDFISQLSLGNNFKDF